MMMINFVFIIIVVKNDNKTVKNISTAKKHATVFLYNNNTNLLIINKATLI